MCDQADYAIQSELAKLATRLDGIDARIERQSETIGYLRDEVKELRHEDAQGDVKHAAYEERLKNLERVAYGGGAVGIFAALGHLPKVAQILGGG